jgi:hypothetical protein
LSVRAHLSEIRELNPVMKSSSTLQPVIKADDLEFPGLIF